MHMKKNINNQIIIFILFGTKKGTRSLSKETNNLFLRNKERKEFLFNIIVRTFYYNI